MVDLLIKIGVKKMVIFHRSNEIFLYVDIYNIKKCFKTRILKRLKKSGKSI